MPDALSGCWSENCWKQRRRINIKSVENWVRTVSFHSLQQLWLQSSSYLQQLDGLAVLLLPAQLSHLDEDGLWVTRVLGLEAGGQFPALVGLWAADTAAEREQWRKDTFSGSSEPGRGQPTWLVYMASRALFRSMACSCFLASLYSTPSVFVSFTFFLESNTFWS